MDESSVFLNGLFGLHGRVAIVSGSTGGLGQGIALALFQAGANVVINGRTQTRAILSREEIYLKTSRNSGLLALEGDMSSPTDAKHVVDQTIAEFGRIDIIVNNAGVNLPEKPFEVSTLEDWEHLSAANISGPVNLTKAALPYLKQSSAGRIINVSSIAGHVGMPCNTMYSMTKASMLLFTKSLSVELQQMSYLHPTNDTLNATSNTLNGFHHHHSRNHITVNSISPGVFATPMNAKFELGTAARAEILRHIPMGRLGEAHELVGIVVYLASSASAYTTGADFLVDGGYCAV